jgi:hypothetical protein
LLTEHDFKEWGARYLVFQVEQGEKTFVTHLQGYIEMPKPVRFTHFHPALEGANFGIPNGTGAQNRAYCTKEATRMDGPYEFGTMSGGSGQRTDLLALRDAVKSGKRGRELFDDDGICASAIKYSRGVEKLVESYSTPLPRDDIRVVLHFGPANVGKTHCCYQSDPGAYFFDGGAGDFFIGYKGEESAILDEFSGRTMPPLLFQRLADKYPLWLNVKGSQVPCNVCINPNFEGVFF